MSQSIVILTGAGISAESGLGTFRDEDGLWAHDEFDLCSVGDRVRIEPTRALSKRKAHVVVEILRKEDGSAPPNPFPSF